MRASVNKCLLCFALLCSALLFSLSLPSPGPSSDSRFNTHVLVDDSGAIHSSYRKIHLFDVDVPNGPTLHESKDTAPGDALVCAKTPLGNLVRREGGRKKGGELRGMPS